MKQRQTAVYPPSHPNNDNRVAARRREVSGYGSERPFRPPLTPTTITQLRRGAGNSVGAVANGRLPPSHPNNDNTIAARRRELSGCGSERPFYPPPHPAQLPRRRLQ